MTTTADHRSTTSLETLQTLLEGLENLTGDVEAIAEAHGQGDACTDLSWTARQLRDLISSSDPASPAGGKAAMVHPARMNEHMRVRADRRMRRRVSGYPELYVGTFAGGDPLFALWLAICDDRLLRNLATTHQALGGAGWREAYDARTDPLAYADRLTFDVLTHDD